MIFAPAGGRATTPLGKMGLAGGAGVEREAGTRRNRVNDLKQRPAFVAKWQLLGLTIVQARRVLEHINPRWQRAGHLVGGVARRIAIACVTVETGGRHAGSGVGLVAVET